MNRVPIKENGVDSIFDLGCTSMVVCGSKGMKVHNDHKKGFFLEFYMEMTFSVLS